MACMISPSLVMVGFWHWLAQMISIHCLSLDFIINLVGGFNPSEKY
jgi:hypothetical protein